MNVGLARDDLLRRGTADEATAPSAESFAQVQNVPVAVHLGPTQPGKPPDLAEWTSEQLAERSSAGCLEAFEQLVLRYENRLFNFFWRFTSNHHDAEDLTQETFVRAHRSLHRYDASFSFSAWLFTIARRTGANHFRSVEHFEELPADEQSALDSPATALERKDEQNSIWRLIQTLKPKLAQALWLRYAEGFSIAETARIMHTNQIHVKVMLHRGRTSLAKMLSRNHPAGGGNPKSTSTANGG